MCHYYLKTRNCPYEKVCICIYMALGGFASSYISVCLSFIIGRVFSYINKSIEKRIYMIQLLGWLHVFS